MGHWGPQRAFQKTDVFYSPDKNATRSPKWMPCGLYFMFSLFILPVVVMALSPLKLEYPECLDSDSRTVYSQSESTGCHARAWLVTYEELLAKQSETGPDRCGIRAQTCGT